MDWSKNRAFSKSSTANPGWKEQISEPDARAGANARENIDINEKPILVAASRSGRIMRCARQGAGRMREGNGHAAGTRGHGYYKAQQNEGLFGCWYSNNWQDLAHESFRVRVRLFSKWSIGRMINDGIFHSNFDVTSLPFQGHYFLIHDLINEDK